MFQSTQTPHTKTPTTNTHIKTVGVESLIARFDDFEKEKKNIKYICTTMRIFMQSKK